MADISESMKQEKFNVILSAFVLISNFVIILSAHYNIIDKTLAYTLFVIQTLLYSFNEFSRAWLIYNNNLHSNLLKKPNSKMR
jgi:hypothetical protein